ncbi:MAG: hypothetical protein U0Q16_20335 [Bryobacteraceae bacterium]
MIRSISFAALLALAALLVLAGCSRSGSASDQQKREDEFAAMMSGATLVGKFSSGKSDQLKEDRYFISKISRLAGNVWIFQTRMGEHDVPVPVKVVWAGDTPMITLTDAGIPGMGSFTARVLFYRDQYAGTWSSSKGHGGQMFGRIERK